MSVYAYLHCRPDGSPFYVGKGKLRRVKSLSERNFHHASIVAKYGRKNILVGKLECSSDQIAYELEMGLIKCLQRNEIKLTNYTAGGDGGREPCEETRKRMSEAGKRRGVSEVTHLARIKAKTGVPISEEQKEKQRRALIGIKRSEEFKEKMRQIGKQRIISPAFREAARLINLGKPWSEERRKKIMEAKSKK